jgi:hypothetical protein
MATPTPMRAAPPRSSDADLPTLVQVEFTDSRGEE